MTFCRKHQNKSNIRFCALRRKYGITVTPNIQSYRALGVTPVFLYPIVQYFEHSARNSDIYISLKQSFISHTWQKFSSEFSTYTANTNTR